MTKHCWWQRHFKKKQNNYMKNYFVKNCDSQRVYYICAFQRGQYLCIVCIFCVPQQKQTTKKNENLFWIKCLMLMLLFIPISLPIYLRTWMCGNRRKEWKALMTIIHSNSSNFDLKLFFVHIEKKISSREA
jgi:hypothetical protein